MLAAYRRGGVAGERPRTAARARTAAARAGRRLAVRDDAGRGVTPTLRPASYRVNGKAAVGRCRSRTGDRPGSLAPRCARARCYRQAPRRGRSAGAPHERDAGICHSAVTAPVPQHRYHTSRRPPVDAERTARPSFPCRSPGRPRPSARARLPSRPSARRRPPRLWPPAAPAPPPTGSWHRIATGARQPDAGYATNRPRCPSTHAGYRSTHTSYSANHRGAPAGAAGRAAPPRGRGIHH
jgi:hypothetical protein